MLGYSETLIHALDSWHGLRWQAVCRDRQEQHNMTVLFHCAFQLQQTDHDKREFHQVPQRETEGLSAQRGAVSTSSAGPDQGSD